MLVFFKLSYWKKQIIKKYYPEHLIFIDSTRALKRLVLKFHYNNSPLHFGLLLPIYLTLPKMNFSKRIPLKYCALKMDLSDQMG